MKQSSQGIVKNDKAEEQPADKRRAQTVHRTGPDQSVSREETRDVKQSDAQKTPSSRNSRAKS